MPKLQPKSDTNRTELDRFVIWANDAQDSSDAYTSCPAGVR